MSLGRSRLFPGAAPRSTARAAARGRRPSTARVEFVKAHPIDVEQLVGGRALNIRLVVHEEEILPHTKPSRDKARGDPLPELDHAAVVEDQSAFARAEAMPSPSAAQNVSRAASLAARHRGRTPTTDRSPRPPREVPPRGARRAGRSRAGGLYLPRRPSRRETRGSRRTIASPTSDDRTARARSSRARQLQQDAARRTSRSS